MCFESTNLFTNFSTKTKKYNQKKKTNFIKLKQTVIK